MGGGGRSRAAREGACARGRRRLRGRGHRRLRACARECAQGSCSEKATPRRAAPPGSSPRLSAARLPPTYGHVRTRLVTPPRPFCARPIRNAARSYATIGVSQNRPPSGPIPARPDHPVVAGVDDCRQQSHESWPKPPPQAGGDQSGAHRSPPRAARPAHSWRE